MPWTSIIMWLLSFLLSKSSGASTGKAAAIATGVGLATYYAADPANPDNLLGFKIGEGAKAVPGDVTADNGTAPGSGVMSTVVSEVGSTLKSWGPTGTLGVIAGTAAVTSVDKKDWLLWAAVGVGAILILK